MADIVAFYDISERDCFRKLAQLAWVFDLLNNDHSSLPLEKRGGVTTVTAVCGWQYGVLHPLRNASG